MNSAPLYPLLDLERYKWFAEIASTSSHPEQTNLNAQTNRFSHSVSRWAESFTRTSDQPPFRPLTSASYLSSVIDVLASDNFGESIRGLATQTHRREFRLSEAQQVVQESGQSEPTLASGQVSLGRGVVGEGGDRYHEAYTKTRFNAAAAAS